MKNMKDSNPSPFVYWAQTKDFISLKVDLKDAKDYLIEASGREVKFSAQGYGARGLHHYNFSLLLHSNIESFAYKVTDNHIDITLEKIETTWWPRLTATPQKPVWIKVDFDRWKFEECDEDEKPRDVLGDYPEMFHNLHKQEYGYKKEDLKKVYLAFYNLFQFIGFSYILIVMAIRYYRDGPKSIEGTYEAVGNALKFLQLMQFLEVMNPLFGYVKGGFISPLMQVGGRTIILFCMIEAEPRMHTKPVVFYLIFIWSLIEIVRYPYYISQVYKTDIGILTWLRYTMWIPLYPLGFLCEGIIVLRNIPYFEETLKFTVSLPNTWNFTFYFPNVLRIYLLLFFFPAMYVMMSHMYRARVKKIGSSRKFI